MRMVEWLVWVLNMVGGVETKLEFEEEVFVREMVGRIRGRGLELWW